MKRFLAALLVTILLITTSGCAGSITKDAYNQLKLVRAAYVTAAPARADYCRPWERPIPEQPAPAQPKPAVCKEALDVLTAVYTVLDNGTTLLATYAKVKTEDVKAQIIAMMPEIANALIDAQTVAGRFGK